MDNQCSPEPREFRHCFTQMTFVHMREFVDPRGNQKAFETNNPSVPKPCEFGAVIRHHPAPKPGIDMKLAARRRLFGSKSCECRCRRNRVERHVNDCGHASGCRRPGCRFKTFPISSAAAGGV